ncbi:MAG: helix-turn-helix transcriptional regulator [Flavobacteriales bacterium]
MSDFLNIESISQLHKMLGYQKPEHPLVTVLDYSKIKADSNHYDIKIVTDFYVISLKSPSPKSVQYGRQYYDFEEGSIMFLSPKQVFSVSDFNENNKSQGWGIYFHPDLISNSALGQKIKDFSFFSYAVSEALHVSEKEKQILTSLSATIIGEYSEKLDEYSQGVIITAIEQLLNYSQRFYSRQFLTRKKLNKDLISRFEDLLKTHFQSEKLKENGLPKIDYFASQLRLSPNYLTDLLKKETGKTAKEHIHLTVISSAKYKLLNSADSVKEIAFSLGFEYPQYFSRLFKSKTGLTPLEFREVR